MSTPLRVFFVSSSEQDTRLIIGELQRDGYVPDHERVDAADTLSIALRRDWDILIVNHSATIFAAPDIIALVKGIAPYLPLIVVAGDGGEAAAVEAMRIGAADSVMRSDLRRLSSVIDRELRKAADGRDQRMAAQLREDGERRAVDELREGNEARYRAIFDTAGDAIVVADDRGVIQSFNRAAEKAFGYPADEIIGHNVRDLMPEPDSSRHNKYMAAYRRTGQAKIIGIGRDVQGRRKDGSVFSHDRLAARNVTYQDFATGHNGDRLAGFFVVITLSDTGSGIPPDLLPHVFEPFVTTKDVGKGSGLALSQVYGFTHQSGGAAGIASELGKGSTVTLYLPASQNHTRGRAAAKESNDRRPKKAVILVVEDDADVAEIAVSFLKRSGYAVELVDNAPAALDVLARQPVDLVFSDVLLAGGMNGIALAQEINLRYSSLPVLLTTGYSDAAIDAEAKGLTIVRKPCSPHAVVTVIAETLRRGSIASAAPGG